MRSFKQFIFKSSDKEKKDGLTNENQKRLLKPDFNFDSQKKITHIFQKQIQIDTKPAFLQKKSILDLNFPAKILNKTPNNLNQNFDKSNQKNKTQKNTPVKNKNCPTRNILMKMFNHSFKGSEVETVQKTSKNQKLLDQNEINQNKTNFTSMHELSIKKNDFDCFGIDDCKSLGSQRYNDSNSESKRVCHFIKNHKKLIINNEQQNDILTKNSSFCDQIQNQSRENFEDNTNKIISNLRKEIKNKEYSRKFDMDNFSEGLNMEECLKILSQLNFFDTNFIENDSFYAEKDSTIFRVIFETLKSKKTSRVDLKTLKKCILLLKTLETLSLATFDKTNKEIAKSSPNVSQMTKHKKSSLSNKNYPISQKSINVGPFEKISEKEKSPIIKQSSIPEIVFVFDNPKSPDMTLKTVESPIDKVLKELDQIDCSQFTFKKNKKKCREVCLSDFLSSEKIESPEQNDNIHKTSRNIGAMTFQSNSPDNFKTRKAINLVNEFRKMTEEQNVFSSPADLKPSADITKQPIEKEACNNNFETDFPTKILFSTTITFNNKPSVLTIYEHDNLEEIVQKFAEVNSIEQVKCEYLIQMLKERKNEILESRKSVI